MSACDFTVNVDDPICIQVKPQALKTSLGVTV